MSIVALDAPDFRTISDFRVKPAQLLPDREGTQSSGENAEMPQDVREAVQKIRSLGVRAPSKR